MTREEIEIKAKEFDSKLKRHPMSSEELRGVLCDFVESFFVNDFIEQNEDFCANAEAFVIWLKEQNFESYWNRDNKLMYYRNDKSTEEIPSYQILEMFLKNKNN
jgi:hypothetical protein